MSFSRANTSNNPAKALELVRAALQPSLNADIERVLLSYQEVYCSHIQYYTWTLQRKSSVFILNATVAG